MKLNIFLFFVAAVALASCVDIPDFDVVPQIGEAISVQQEKRVDIDTVRDIESEYEYVSLTITFTDGDGDLGLTSDERNDSTIRQSYTKVPGWGVEGNYQLVVYELAEDGKTWFEKTSGVPASNWMPILKPDGKPGPIKGKVDLYIRYYYPPRSYTLKKHKYKVRIIDRAFHISNWSAESDAVTVPAY